MFNIDEIYKLDNFLTDDERKGFDILCSHYVWKLEGFSHNTSKMFWIKDMWGSDLGQCHDIEYAFRTKLERTFDIKLETQRLYLNGQAHGQCGQIHTDLAPNDSGNFLTLVYYVNTEWNPELGGFTVIIDKNDNIHAVYPKPNSAVLFNSELPHVGLEPTSYCRDQRVTLAHKFKIIEG